MTFGTYCRIETEAGGVTATRRELIRAFRKALSPEGKSRARREMRHRYIREMFRMHDNALQVYRMCTL